jgi:hypothetical protein
MVPGVFSRQLACAWRQASDDELASSALLPELVSAVELEDTPMLAAALLFDWAARADFIGSEEGSAGDDEAVRPASESPLPSTMSWGSHANVPNRRALQNAPRPTR